MPLPSPILDSDLALDTLPVPDFAAFVAANFPGTPGDPDGSAADIADAVATLGAASSVLDSADSDFADVISIAPGLDTSAIDSTVAQFDGADAPNGNAILTEMGGVQAEWTPGGAPSASGPTAPGAATGGLSGTATLQGVTVTTPGIASIGETVQFRATANYSDSSQADVTAQAAWSSSAPAIVSVDAAGKGTASATGQATITAAFQGATGQTGIAVQATNTNVPAPGAILQSVRIDSIGGFVQMGQTYQQVMRGIYSDGTQVDVTGIATWQSSDPAVASVNANGLITFNAPGTPVITGTLFGFTDTASFTVIQSVASAPPPVSSGISTGFNQGAGGCDDSSGGKCAAILQ